jgi:hypothetical protein
MVGFTSAPRQTTLQGVALTTKTGDTYQISIAGYEVLYSTNIWYFDSALQGSTDLSREQFLFGQSHSTSFKLGSPATSSAAVSSNAALLTQAIASFDPQTSALQATLPMSPDVGASPNFLAPQHHL